MGDENHSGVFVRRRRVPSAQPMPNAGLSALRQWLADIRLEQSVYVADLRNKFAEFAAMLRELGFTRKASYREMPRPHSHVAPKRTKSPEPKHSEPRMFYLTWTGEIVAVDGTPSDEMTITQLVWAADNLDKLLSAIEGSETAEVWRLQRAVQTLESFLEYLKGPAQEPPPEPASNE